MSGHLWKLVEGVEVHPYMSFHTHLWCALCSRVAPPDALERGYDSGPCPGTDNPAARKCDNCGLRQIWTEEFCPKCDHPPITGDGGPAENYQRYLVAKARKEARGKVSG